MNPGFYENLSYAEYDQIDALRFSALKHMERSPLAYRYNLDTPAEPTDAMVLGNAAHIAILEPSLADFAVWTGGRRAGKEFDLWCEETDGRFQVNEKEMKRITGIRDAVHADPDARHYLRIGKKELTMVWRDPSFARVFKARIDNYVDIDDEPVLVSLKSTVDCRDFRFESQYAKMAYHAQDAIYQNGFFQLAHQLPRMVTVAVESKPPHETAVYDVPTDALRVGQQLVSKWVLSLAECERSNTWPRAMKGVRKLQLPSWAVPGGDFQFDDLEPIER